MSDMSQAADTIARAAQTIMNAVSLYAEIEMMKTTNAQCTSEGKEPLYGENDFISARQRWS